MAFSFPTSQFDLCGPSQRLLLSPCSLLACPFFFCPPPRLSGSLEGDELMVLACSESTHLLRSLPRAPRWGLGKSNRDKQPFPSVSDIQAEQQFQSKSRPFLLLSCSGSHTAFVSVLGIYAPSFSVQPQIHSTPSLSLKLLSKYGGKLVAPQGQ